MRSDMTKVIVERPRRGHADRYRPARNSRKHDLSEDAPLREGMKRPHIMNYEGKQLNENLNPLKRFLRKQAGRPWDKVYSEINEHVKVTSAVQAHVREHIEDFIHLRVYSDEFGRIWEHQGYGPRLLRKGDLYVDTNGLVRVFRQQPKFKFDPGWKVYALYRARTSKRMHRDLLSNNSYYEVEYRVVERDKMAKAGVTADRVSSYFYAASHREALKKADEENRLAGKYSWHSREYVPHQKDRKPKAKVSS